MLETEVYNVKISLEDGAQQIWLAPVSMQSKTEIADIWQQLVSVLSRSQKVKGGPEMVKGIGTEWKGRYRNRQARMDE